MKNNKVTTIINTLALFLPSFALAQATLYNSTFRNVILGAVNVLKSVVPILVSISFAMFFWGVAKFILNSNNSAERQNGRRYMFGAVIAIFILFSFVGIITFIQAQFGFSTTQGNGGIIYSILLPGSQ